MKKSHLKISFLTLILSLSSAPISLALEMPTKYEAVQGNSLEVNIPRGKHTYIEATFEGQSLLFQKQTDQFKAYLGINRLTEPGLKELKIMLFTPGIGSEYVTIPVNVKKTSFITQHFTLPKKTQKLFEKDYQTPTWEMIYTAMENPIIDPVWTDKFKLPTTGRITLGFGDKLYINKKYSGSHFGIDYANKKGTPIYATNSGTIKLASMTPAYGNVILIDHGLNIYSMYLHLDSFDVQAGDQVEQGDLIGKIGSTGLAEGPHLHFTMFVGKTVVNSDQWIN
ncbi:M23 family metallopeptidase [Candidatus Peregrinibacteria bacterium]|nr:M23 family metallopeptidase [Candidatus Peregrinibacteria bacterium]